MKWGEWQLFKFNGGIPSHGLEYREDLNRDSRYRCKWCKTMLDEKTKWSCEKEECKTATIIMDGENWSMYLKRESERKGKKEN